MSTTKTKALEAIKNDGGTVVAGGTLSDSPMTKVVNVNELNTGSEYGSKVVENVATGNQFTDPHGVIKAKSAGTGGLAYYPDPYAGERNFVLRAAGDSAGKINNDAASLLNVPGAQFAGVGQDSVHKLLTSRRLGVTTYNVLAVPSSGVFPGRTKGAGAGNVITYVAPTGNGTVAGTDDAASSTRAVPGELTYHFGALAVPTTADYKAKDSAES
jgi:hypothetical protein